MVVSRVDLAARHRLLVTIEDSGRVGGMGSVLTQMLADADVRTPVRVHGVTQEFFDHAKRAVLLERMGLTGEAVAADAGAQEPTTDASAESTPAEDEQAPPAEEGPTASNH